MVIISHSKVPLCTEFTPNKGSAGNSSGNNPQCMAQRTEVNMPNPSQLTFIFIYAKITYFIMG
jgi:hypothetical protein